MTRTTQETAPTTAAAAPEPYTRQAWELSIMLSNLHRSSRHVALVLSHYADVHGELAEGGVQDVAALELATGLSGKNVRLSLTALERRGWLRRPDIREWPAGRGVRPVTLTMPPAAARPEPPHSGEAG